MNIGKHIRQDNTVWYQLDGTWHTELDIKVHGDAIDEVDDNVWTPVWQERHMDASVEVENALQRTIWK